MDTLPKTAIVIGAGLAGANIANRLAARDWQVNLCETSNAVASGASGNHAGIVLPQLAKDDALGARFSRLCYAYLLQRLTEFPRCDWHPCGVLQIARDEAHESRQSAAVEELQLPASFVEFLSRQRAEKLVGLTLTHGAWWFSQGGYMAPASLCAALLAQQAQKIRCHFSNTVSRLSYDGKIWSAYAADDSLIATATHLVLANAQAANELLAEAFPLKVIRGQISYLPATSVPETKVVLCRNGYLTPAQNGQVTFGASFVNDDSDLELRSDEHLANLQRLQEILPEFKVQTAAIDLRNMSGRVALRAVTPDRLPLVGRVPKAETKSPRHLSLQNLPRLPNLFALLGLSARGIVWAPLCAEHLACIMNEEPSPLPQVMVDAIDAGRFYLRELRQR